MALTREFLRGMSLTEEQVSAIIAEHVDVKKAIEKQRDDLQKQLDDRAKEPDWHQKHDDLQKSFDDYKAAVTAKETLAAKHAAFRKLLTAENIPAKFHDRIVKMTDFDALELDNDAIKDEKAARTAIKADWGEYVATPETQTTPPATPPASTPAPMTRAEIYKKDDYGRYVMSTAERQKALAEHPELMK